MAGPNTPGVVADTPPPAAGVILRRPPPPSPGELAAGSRKAGPLLAPGACWHRPLCQGCAGRLGGRYRPAPPWPSSLPCGRWRHPRSCGPLSGLVGEACGLLSLEALACSALLELLLG